MLNEAITREQTRLRVQNHRNKERNNQCNAPSNAKVTPNKSEVRSHKSEEEGEREADAPPPDLGLKDDRKPQKQPKQTDAEWLADLSTSPAYRGIDVRREHAKALVWATANKKTMSRRRFVNWLNRCETTLNAQAPQGQERPAVPEPNGWRNWINENAPDSVYARGGTREGEQWSALDRTTQDWLTKQTVSMR